MHLSQTASGTGKILGGHKNGTALHFSESGNDAVRLDLFCIHAEQGGSVFHKQLDLLEGAFVEQQIYPFPSRQFFPLMLPLNGLLSPHGQQVVPLLFECPDLICGCSHLYLPFITISQPSRPP